MEGRTVESTVVRMSELMTPTNANFLGKVFGGSILAMLDKVAYVTASRFAGRTCVTASFDRVDFHSPIEVGELVHMEGRVDYVGRTSVQVRIEVNAENIHHHTMRHTNTCIVTMVAIDDNGRPTPVPPLICETPEEKRRFLIGKLRREFARSEKDEYKALVERVYALSDDDLDAWLSSEKIRP